MDRYKLLFWMTWTAGLPWVAKCFPEPKKCRGPLLWLVLFLLWPFTTWATATVAAAQAVIRRIRGSK